MTSNVIHLLIMLVIAIAAHIYHKWSVASIVFFSLFVISDNDLIKGCGFILFILFLCLDGKRKDKDSVFSKYNIYSPHCILSKRAVLVISVLGMLVSILAMMALLWGKR